MAITCAFAVMCQPSDYDVEVLGKRSLFSQNDEKSTSLFLGSA